MHLTATEPTLEEKIAFLSSPEAYGERLGHVEVIETHMSWLFLTPRHVYKIKKPVHNEYFDPVRDKPRRSGRRRIARTAEPSYNGVAADNQGSLRQGMPEVTLAERT